MSDTNFSKEKALDDILEFFNKVNEKQTISEMTKASLAAQNYIQRMHDKAYADGFQKAIEIAENIENEMD